MCEQDYENKKLVITKFSFFWQTLNSNFRLSASRALYDIWELNTSKSEHAGLKFERSQETQRIILKSQNMPDVMILVFRKRGMYCFKSPKMCALSSF